jgi:nucleoside 2-deoxyribosyltransferase
LTRKSRIYLAGPLGFSELGRTGQDSLAQELARLGYEVIDPFKLTSKEEIDRVAGLHSLDEQREAWRVLNRQIGETNRKAIDGANALVAVLDGVDVDSGTAAEIGYAYARGKPIVGYRGDFRLSADNIGSTVNLQVEYFIRGSGGSIVTTTAEIGPALLAALQPA